MIENLSGECGMGRRRKQVVKIVRRTLPELYLCPRCGKNPVKAAINKQKARVAGICRDWCRNCGDPRENHLAEVDAYCLFVDAFYSGDAPEESVVE